jgi:hypothetical protein
MARHRCHRAAAEARVVSQCGQLSQRPIDKAPAERIRLFRRRRKFRRQLVMVEVDPREVDALIERGYLEPNDRDGVGSTDGADTQKGPGRDCRYQLRVRGTLRWYPVKSTVRLHVVYVKDFCAGPYRRHTSAVGASFALTLRFAVVLPASCRGRTQAKALCRLYEAELSAVSNSR